MSILSDIAIVTPGGFVANITGKLIDTVASFFPNPEKKAEAVQALAAAQQAGAFREEEQQVQLMLEQIKVNEVEAASTNWFVAGWRPAVGWVCAIGLGYEFLIMPLGNAASLSFGGTSVFIALDVQTLMTCLAGLLGLGTMRTVEKSKGVEGNR